MRHKALYEAMRVAAAAFPEATEDWPWGHAAAKVRGKAFAFLGVGDESMNVSLKLPDSHEMATTLPFVTPTGYGLGKSGWVTVSLGDVAPPVDLLIDWLFESYCAVAPKRLSKALTAPPDAAVAALEALGDDA